MTAEAAYDELIRRSRQLAVLNSCTAVLGWDQQTYLPAAGAPFRGEQLALLAKLGHEQATDPAIGELLSTVEGSPVVADAQSEAAANVRELRHAFDRATKLPGRLVEELAKVTSDAQQAWQLARSRSRFAEFQPYLDKILQLKREEADAIGYAEHRYDALLDEFEPGATAKEVQAMFAELSTQLVPLIQKISESSKKPKAEILHRDFPIDRQKLFAESAAAAIGFDFQAGRLDVTTHPFCSGFGPGDCRITTRYNPKFFSEAFFGVLHEAGHGMYEQNLPTDKYGTPCGSFCSLGVHESQSRLWENQVGRSQEFWQHFFPRLRQTFPQPLQDVTPDDFWLAINDSQPSFIRVEADEVTYNLHVALRFEMELALLSGDLPVADLPAAWNQRFHELFGLEVPDDRHGCLQDIHWSFGGIGYFPTYTIGNVLAAQLMVAARQELGSESLAESFRAGDFHPLKQWLVEKVHSQGRHFRANALCERITGQQPTAAPLVEYLQSKYGQVLTMLGN